MKKGVNQLTFWIVGAIFLCYSIGIGFVQGTGPYSLTSNFNTSLSAKHYRIRISRHKSESWVKVNDTDLLTNGGINNSEVKLIRTKRKYDNRIRFQCVKLPNRGSIIKATSVIPCIEHCWITRYEFALLKRVDECTCLGKKNKYRVVALRKCNKRCSGDDYSNCGGVHVWSKYETGYVREPQFEEGSIRQVQDAYQGCFRAIQVKSFQKGWAFSSLRMHPTMCMAYCYKRKSKLCALEIGVRCYCAKKIEGVLQKSNPKNCRRECAGYKRYTCGGVEGILSVYLTESEALKRLFKNRKDDKRFEHKSVWRQAQIPASVRFRNFELHLEKRKRTTTEKPYELPEEERKVISKKKIVKSIEKVKRPENRNFTVIGIIGAVIFLFIVVTCCKDSIQSKKREEERKQLIEERKFARELAAIEKE